MEPTPILDSSAASQWIRSRWNSSPRFGIILGTGAGQLAEQIEIESIFPYSDIPGFPRSTAIGHKGQLVCGKLDGHLVLAMQGRFHLYEGYSFDLATLPIRVMHQLGVEVLFVTNASGGINPKFASGEIMTIDSHIDLMFRKTPWLERNATMGRPSRRADQYDPDLIESAVAIGRQNDFPVHCGVYAAMLGPNYETRAEYRFLKKIGADVVGMSTVPEVTVAAQLGVRVLGLSIVSNVAKPDVLEATSGQEVIDAASTAEPNLLAIVRGVVGKVGRDNNPVRVT